MPSCHHPIGQHAVHHQLIERRLVADGLHPLLGVIELARCPTRAAAVSFGRHLTNLWPGGDYEIVVTLTVEQLPSDAVWAQGRRQSGEGKVGLQFFLLELLTSCRQTLKLQVNPSLAPRLKHLSIHFYSSDTMFNSSDDIFNSSDASFN